MTKDDKTPKKKGINPAVRLTQLLKRIETAECKIGEWQKKKAQLETECLDLYKKNEKVFSNINDVISVAKKSNSTHDE